MAYFDITIPAASDLVATLRVLRRYSQSSLGELKRSIGAPTCALVFSEQDYPIEIGLYEGHKHQHKRILQACAELREIGATVQLSYWVVEHSSSREIVTEPVARNLMASHLGDLQQLHD